MQTVILLIAAIVMFFCVDFEHPGTGLLFLLFILGALFYAIGGLS